MTSQSTYAVKHNNEEVISNSRSGGIFTALSDFYLENGGVVYGCVLTEQFTAMHVRAENKIERDLMRGSKYIQSRMGETFKLVKQDLENGRKVFFTGTPCQVAGLNNYLGGKYDDLFCIDILCHGVPSPIVWKKYLNWQKNRIRKNIVKVDFRNKIDFGWRAHYETLWLENGRKVSSRVFTNLFYQHVILRPSCYECPFKSINRMGDISIADYWGIEKAAPKFDDDKGVSLVIVNSEKGDMLFNQVKNNILWQETKIEDSMQKALKESYQKPQNRKEFWKDYMSKPFSMIAKKYGKNDLLSRIRELYRMYKKKVKANSREGKW